MEGLVFKREQWDELNKGSREGHTGFLRGARKKSYAIV